MFNDSFPKVKPNHLDHHQVAGFSIDYKPCLLLVSMGKKSYLTGVCPKWAEMSRLTAETDSTIITTGSKLCPKHKMAAPVSRIFQLHCCTTGGSGVVSSLIMNRLWWRWKGSKRGIYQWGNQRHVRCCCVSAGCVVKHICVSEFFCSLVVKNLLS